MMSASISMAGRGVGCKEGIARTCGKHHDAPLFQVPYGTPADIGLADLVDPQRRHDPAVATGLLDGILQGQRIDDRGQHAHVVPGNPVHAAGRHAGPPDDVAAANHHTHLDAGLADLPDVGGDTLDHAGIDTMRAVTHQGLAAQLQQYPLVLHIIPIFFNWLLHAGQTGLKPRYCLTFCQRKPSLWRRASQSPAAERAPGQAGVAAKKRGRLPAPCLMA
jgi:hypothetical protein